MTFPAALFDFFRLAAWVQRANAHVMVTRYVLISFIALLSLQGCRQPVCSRQPTSSDAPFPAAFPAKSWSFVTEPGASYRLTFAHAQHDGRPQGYQWTWPDMLDAPVLRRTPVIIKADDFGHHLNAASLEFIESVERMGGVVSLGIITSHLSGSANAAKRFCDLQQRGHEMWFHGHSHHLKPSPEEFRDSGMDAQRRSFGTGLSAAQYKLGMSLVTFGAPGNAIDNVTETVVNAFPQIHTWFFGTACKQCLILPWHIGVEEETAVMRDPDAFFDELDAMGDVDVLTLQVHPIGWSETSVARHMEILEGIVARGRYRFATPDEVWREHQNTGKVRITKVSDTEYVLDVANNAYSQWFGFDQNDPPLIDR